MREIRGRKRGVSDAAIAAGALLDDADIVDSLEKAFSLSSSGAPHDQLPRVSRGLDESGGGLPAQGEHFLAGLPVSS